MARTIFYVPPLAVTRARRGSPSTLVGSDGWSHRTECRRAVLRSTLCASALAAGSCRFVFCITKRLTLDAPSLRKSPRLPPWSGPSRKDADETRSAALTPTTAKLIEGRRDRVEGKHERSSADHLQHLCNPPDLSLWIRILTMGSLLTVSPVARGRSCSFSFDSATASRWPSLAIWRRRPIRPAREHTNVWRQGQGPPLCRFPETSTLALLSLGTLVTAVLAWKPRRRG